MRRPEEIVRFRDDPQRQQAAALLSAALPEPLSDVHVERLLRRMRHAASASARPRFALVVRIAMALATLGAAGTVTAAWITGVGPFRRPEPATVPSLPPPREPVAEPALPAPTATAPVALKPAPRIVRRAPIAPPSTRPPPAEDPSAGESALVRAAITALGAHDAAGALERLQDYRARFPRGLLAREADVVRVDALLALGRKRDALAALEALPIAELPRRTELLVVTGELRASLGQCRGAGEAFDRALADATGPLRERVLYGRAVCLANVGNTSTARAAFDEYLRQFPSGRFAAESRRALGR
jgi:TolA-binding protein